ncbi:MAG: LCP family protein [Clostridia bacterium]|nr:LCP family protein [Clostridia bacterium]
MNNQSKTAGAGFGSSLGTKVRRVRTRKALKIVLVVLTALLLVITSLGAAIVMPLIQAYDKSYTEVPIITTPPGYSFVIPPMLGDDMSGKPFVGENGNWWIGDYDTLIKVEYGASETDDTGVEYTPLANEPIIGENGNWQIGNVDIGIKAEVTTGIPEPPPVTTGPDGNSGSTGTGKPVTVNGIYKVEKKDPDIENILLVGTDSRNMSSLKGRSDTMIVCSYNKRIGKAKLVSFMRDTLVPIDGLGKNGGVLWQRLNATFSLSGIACTVNTINQLFGLDIQRFVIINFEGTKNLIDSCGGVNVKLTDTPNDPRGEVQWIQNSGYKVVKNSDGTYHLDGAAALIHMRQRYGSSDVTRTNRQRKVLMALFQQVVASRDITEIYDLVRNAFNSKMFQTNIPLTEMLDLAASVASNGANMSIGSHRIPTSYWSIRFNMSTQQQVSTGGAQVLQINFTEQKNKVQEYIYGK